MVVFCDLPNCLTCTKLVTSLTCSSNMSYHSKRCISVQHCPCYPSRRTLRPVTRRDHRSQTHYSIGTLSSPANVPNLPAHPLLCSIDTLHCRTASIVGRLHHRPRTQGARLGSCQIRCRLRTMPERVPYLEDTTEQHLRLDYASSKSRDRSLSFPHQLSQLSTAVLPSG